MYSTVYSVYWLRNNQKFRECVAPDAELRALLRKSSERVVALLHFSDLA